MTSKLLPTRGLAALLLLAPSSFSQEPSIFENAFPKTLFFRTQLAKNAVNMEQVLFDLTYRRLMGIVGVSLPLANYHDGTDGTLDPPQNPTLTSAAYSALKTPSIDDYPTSEWPNPGTAQLALAHNTATEIDPYLLAKIKADDPNDPEYLDWIAPQYAALKSLNAGHFLYFPGAVLTADLDLTSETQVSVSHTGSGTDDVFRITTGLDELQTDFVCIVPVTPIGRLDWANAAHARIVKPEDENAWPSNDFEVATTGLEALNGNLEFSVGDLVLPHAWGGPWGDGGLLWRYNFTPGPYANPTAGFELTASKIRAQFFKDCFEAPVSTTEGPLWAGLDGIQLDVAPGTFQPKYVHFKDRRDIDVAIDITPTPQTVGDGGVVGHEDLFARGMFDHLVDLRAAIPDRIIVVDAGSVTHQRATGRILSGVEAEYLGESSDDDFRMFSWGVNRTRLWTEANLESERELHWGVRKHKTGDLDVNDVDDDGDTAELAPITFAHSRLLLGTFTILGVGAVSIGPNASPSMADIGVGVSFGIWDELRKGEDNELGWLGAPVSDILHPVRNRVDLLRGAGIDLTSASLMTSGFGSEEGGVAVSVGSDSPAPGVLQIDIVEPPFLEDHELKYGRATVTIDEVPEGDLTVFVTMWSEPMDGFEDHPEVPRLVEVRAHSNGGLVHPPSGGSDKIQYSKALVNSSPLDLSFTFRDVAEGDVQLEFVFEGSQPMYMARLTAHSGPDVLAREFENGAVIVNPSFESVDVNTRELFPNRRFRKIQTMEVPSTFGKVPLDDGVNDGSKVVDIVPLGATDGVFLVSRIDAEFRIESLVGSNDPFPSYVRAESAPGAGDGDVVVVFIDESRGTSGTSETIWDFGAGRELSTPENVMFPRGVHTVSLTVSDNGYSDTETKTFLITAVEGAVPNVGDPHKSQDPFPDGGPEEWGFYAWAFDRYEALNKTGAKYTHSHYGVVIDGNHQTPDVYDASRIWTAPVRGRASLGTSATYGVHPINPGGDGVHYSILHNGDVIVPPTYAVTDSTLSDGSPVGIQGSLDGLYLNVEEGDTLEFRVEQANTTNDDTTKFNPWIKLTTGGDFAPTPEFASRCVELDEVTSEFIYEFTDESIIAPGDSVTHDWTFDVDGQVHATATGPGPVQVPFAFGTKDVVATLTLTNGPDTVSKTRRALLDAPCTDSVGFFPPDPADCVNDLPQGVNGWYFYRWDSNDGYVFLDDYDCGTGRFSPSSAAQPWVREDRHRPSDSQDAVRGWLAPSDGHVNVSFSKKISGYTDGDALDLTILRDRGASDPLAPSSDLEVVWGPKTIDYAGTVEYAFDTFLEEGDLLLFQVSVRGDSAALFLEANITYRRVEFTGPLTADVGEEVEFTAWATGNPVAFDWDFDADGEVDEVGLTATYSWASPSTQVPVRCRAYYADGSFVQDLRTAAILIEDPQQHP